VIRKIEKEI
jgi:hypothetical protein